MNGSHIDGSVRGLKNLNDSIKLNLKKKIQISSDGLAIHDASTCCTLDSRV